MSKPETLQKSEYRKIVESWHPTANEQEAIAYARGVTKGLARKTPQREDLEIELFAMRIDDKLLDAGMAFMGLNIVEAMAAESDGKVN